MKKFLFSLVLALASFTANADTAITLTPDQVAALQKAQSPEQKQNISEVVRKEASEWGELGANMGKAMVAAAKEVGVASNEFAQTPLGKITVAIVVYKLIGQDVLGAVVGSFIIILGICFSIFFFKSKTLFAREVKYEYVPYFKGLFSLKRITYSRIDDEPWVFRAIFGIASIVLSLLIGLNTIF